MRPPAILLFAVFVSPAFAQEERAPAPPLQPPWRESALAFVPKGYLAGEAYRTEGDTGYLAVYPEGANDAKTPASTFALRQALLARLSGGKAVSGELKPRDDVPRANRDTTAVKPDETEAEYARLHAELEAKRAELPPGTEPCDLGAWSEDRDRQGLNVRAEPNAKSRVLGTLPPPLRIKNPDADGPRDGFRTEFRIIGYRDGWFLIEGATPPGSQYQDETRYPKNAPKPYAGRGWVASNKVGASYANGDTRMGGLFQAPQVDAKWTLAQRKLGGPLDTDGGPKRVLACSGFWALVESADGVRGWWRRLCSSQVTNCS